MPAELRRAAARYFGSDQPLPTIDDVAAYYRERNLAAVVFPDRLPGRSGVAYVAMGTIATLLLFICLPAHTNTSTKVTSESA